MRLSVARSHWDRMLFESVPNANTEHATKFETIPNVTWSALADLLQHEFACID